jgi:hypothetical protein
MANPVYSPPPPSTGPQGGTPSDHGNINASYTATNAMPTQGGLPVSVPLALPVDVYNAVESVLADPAIDASDDDALNPFAVATPHKIVRLELQNITMPVVANSALRIFLNHANPSKDTPDHDPHHVANVAYFCCGHMGAVQPCFVVDVSRTMKRLRARGQAKKGDAWSVQVLAVPLLAGTSAPTVVPGTFTLTVNSF